MDFVMDRNQTHWKRLKELKAKGWANLTASEKAEWDGEATKGAYNCADLNRVETAVAEISPMFGLSLSTKTDWGVWDIPTTTQMNRYLGNVVAIRDAALAIDSTLKFPELPDSMAFLTWDMANNIEKTLHIAYENALRSVLTWDGSVDGKLVVEGEWVRVSDATPTIEDFAYGFTLAYSDGTDFVFSPDSISEHQGGISLDGHNVVIVYKAGAQIYDSAWPYTGTYFWYPEGLRSLTIPGYTGFRSDTISVTHDGQGNVTVTGITATEAGGNVTLFGVTAADDGNGNITVS